jgi:hypothetical protein
MNRRSGSPSGSGRSFPGDLPARVRRAIRLTTGVDPAGDEVERDLAWIKEMQRESHLTDQAALVQYCLMALSANAFLYLD